MNIRPRRLALVALERAVDNAGSGKVMLRPDEAQLILGALRSAQHGDALSECLLQDDGLPCLCGGKAECENRVTAFGPC